MHIRRYMYINEASNLNNYIYKYVNMHILCSVKKYACYSTYMYGTIIYLKIMFLVNIIKYIYILLLLYL